MLETIQERIAPLEWMTDTEQTHGEVEVRMDQPFESLPTPLFTNDEQAAAKKAHLAAGLVGVMAAFRDQSLVLFQNQ